MLSMVSTSARVCRGCSLGGCRPVWAARIVCGGGGYVGATWWHGGLVVLDGVGVVVVG